VIKWLKKEARGINIIGYVICFVAIDFFYSIFIAELALLLGLISPGPEKEGIKILSLYFPLFLAARAFLEEVVFRLPLGFARKLKLSARNTLALAILLSMIFGLAHGKIINIFIQGVSGLIYSILFLKCGGYQGKIFKPLVTATATHAMFNGTLGIIILLQGGSYF